MNEAKAKIMVVGDDDDARESLCRLLETEGYQVIPATDGLQAVDIFRLKQNPVNLMLVDVNMPRRNGWAMLNQLQELHPWLPVFIVTGFAHQRELAETARVRALVEKPIDEPELLRLIKLELAEPAHPLPARPANRKQPLHHVRAVQMSGSRWYEHPASPYSHWGLNE